MIWLAAYLAVGMVVMVGSVYRDASRGRTEVDWINVMAGLWWPGALAYLALTAPLERAQEIGLREHARRRALARARDRALEENIGEIEAGSLDARLAALEED